jgi:hypothetical protein
MAIPARINHDAYDFMNDRPLGFDSRLRSILSLLAHRSLPIAIALAPVSHPAGEGDYQGWSSNWRS